MIFRIGLAHIGRVGSVFITVSITIERYLSVCRPNSDTHCSKPFLLPVPITFAIIYNIPKFFELETVDTTKNNFIFSKNSTYEADDRVIENNIPNAISYAAYDENVTYIVEDLGYRGTTMRLNPWYIVLYVFWSKFLLVDIIPWIMVIILNYCIWKKIQEFQRVRRTALKKEGGKQA